MPHSSVTTARWAPAELPYAPIRFGSRLYFAAFARSQRTAQRTSAIADLFADEIERVRRKSEKGGPMELLQDERSVQDMPLKLMALDAAPVRAVLRDLDGERYI